jgi:hypothetical protein
MFRLFGPRQKQTVESVAARLVAGLEDGSLRLPWEEPPGPPDFSSPEVLAEYLDRFRRGDEAARDAIERLVSPAVAPAIITALDQPRAASDRRVNAGELVLEVMARVLTALGSEQPANLQELTALAERITHEVVRAGGGGTAAPVADIFRSLADAVARVSAGARGIDAGLEASTQARQAAHPVLNRDREEIQVRRPFGPQLLAFLARRGIRCSVRSEPHADVITLSGEPDMRQVNELIKQWCLAPQGGGSGSPTPAGVSDGHQSPSSSPRPRPGE